MLEASLGVPRLLERFDGLDEPVLGGVFPQRRVEATRVDDEQDGGDALKHLYPLPSLAALSAHVEHAEASRAN